MDFTVKEKKILKSLVLTVAVLLFVCLTAGITLGVLSHSKEKTPDPESPTDDPDTPTVTPGEGRVLAATEDFGQAYIDQMVFLGESTTAHLRSRGVLTGGKNTTQVWSNKDNTMMLDFNILQKTIAYPETGEELIIPAAIAKKKPAFFVISFGLNGVTSFESKPSFYKTAYAKLIRAVHEASPETVVLLQTVYPVSDAQKSFAQGAEEINGYVRHLNELLPEIAKENDAWIVDTASVLTDADGMLKNEYQTDGIHLTAGAYEAILGYLRTHGYRK